MRVTPVLLSAVCLLATCVAGAETYDTITYSFAAVSFQTPGGIPGNLDTVGSIQETVTVLASPVVIPAPFVPDPSSFWINPTYSGPPGSYPPPGDKEYFFGPTNEGFVFADNVEYPRAYFHFKTQGPLFTGPVSSPTFVPGVYAAQYSVPVFGYGFDPGTITIAAVGGPVSAAPESPTLGLELAGLATFLAWAGWRRYARPSGGTSIVGWGRGGSR